MLARLNHLRSAAIAYILDPPGGGVVWQSFLAAALLDLALVIGHAVALILVFFDVIATVPWALSVFNDNSPAEYINYLKWSAIILCAGFAWHKLRVPALMAIVIIFSLVLADDSLRLHESGGALILAKVTAFPDFGSSTPQAAELVIWAALGSIVVPVGVWGFTRSDSEGRRLASYMIVGFFAAVCAGIGLDTAGELVQFLPTDCTRYIGQLLSGLIECLSESLSASLSLAFAIGIAKTACANGIGTVGAAGLSK